MFTSIANRFRRITTNQLYLAEVDGIRFLAFSIVTMFHIRGYFNSHIEKTASINVPVNNLLYIWFNTFFNNADRSIPLFFAISGFVLAMPFAHHYINHGKKINLKLYFLRRLTRLEAPYFIVMICIFVTQIVLGIYSFHTLFPSLLASLIYSHELIYHQTPLVTVVAWTLEVEVQYYIIAPLLFRIFALPTIWRRFIIVSIIVFFVTMQQFYRPSFINLYGSIQHFLIGMLIADLYVSGFAIDFFNKKWVAFLMPVIFIVMFYMPGKEYFTLQPQWLTYAILFPFMIGLMYYIILRNDIIKKIFSYKFIPIIGGMCYTTYLTHYTVISMFGRITTKLHFTQYYFINFLLQFILLVIPVLLIGSVFYLTVERPFMSRKWVDMLMGKKTKE